MENLKNQKIRQLSYNTNDNEFFKASDNRDDFNFPQGKDINILSEYYTKRKGTDDFIEKIGKLNKKFYNCSENYIKSKKRLEKLNDDLYMNLFNQINCYVEEIERLNKKIALNNNQDLKKTIEKLNKDINDKKEKIRNYELKLKEKTENEEKLMKEIESYKRRIIFYKDKIKIGLLSITRKNEVKNRGDPYFFNNKKVIQKNNYLSPNSDDKMKLYFEKNNGNNEEGDLEIKILDKENTKEELNKTEKKPKKLRESIYKINDNPKRDRNFSDLNDLYDKDNDIEEKGEDEYSFNSDLLKLNLDSGSQNFSSKYSKQISHELLTEQNKEEKNKTLDIIDKKSNGYNNQLKKKNSGSLNLLRNKYNKSDIKSKILGKPDKMGSDNKVIKINVEPRNNNDRSRKIDKPAKSRPSNKNNYAISKFPDTSTPFVSSKYTRKYIINRVRPESIKTKEKEKSKINNDRLTTYQKKSSNKGLKELKVNDSNQTSKETNNSEISKKGYKINISKGNPQLIKNRYMNKKNAKDNNNKDLNLILKIVNDDYLNSIEMLKTQEDQIKAMLKLMDLNEN